MIKEIIFDCFGVLTQDGWTAFTKKYAKPEMWDDLHAANELADKGIIGYPEFLRQVSEITGVPAETAHRMVTTSLHPNEDVFEFAKVLGKNYKLGVISNVGSPLETYFPEHYMDVFEVQTLSFREHIIKPSAEIFLRHLEKTDVEPEEAVFIDDRPVNCEGARAAGLHAIHFVGVENLKNELKKLGVSF